MSNIKNYGCAVLFIAPFIIVGIVSFIYPVYQTIIGYRVNNWERVEATVLDVKMITIDDSDGAQSSKVKATYQYIYNGTTYQSGGIAPGYGANNTEAHDELYQVLRKSKRIMIWVNPDNPSQAFIAKAITMSTLGIFIFSLMWNSLLSIFILPRFIKITPEMNRQFLI